ncbi:MAG: c-type cytochrome [Azonexus sp.]|nr:c-type cytochrome [Betaproteobacteria bacterium]MBK8918529.1 c-type cytochrome [Betaproteobacteria bacterium]MBP6035507.1 c-type cytochrome [Azonexus sp.]MBP6906369.1 c-type cytochrome [Azonexus sp.]
MKLLTILPMALFLPALAFSGDTEGQPGNGEAVPPVVDIQALKNLGASWLNENPYRDDAAAIEVGRQAFVQACQRCHGPDALGKGPGPNLRRLSAYCKRIVDASLQRECFGDNDAYFVKSVLKGKTRVGVVHMPPWEGVLSQEVLWALKAYIDSPHGDAQVPR